MINSFNLIFLNGQYLLIMTQKKTTNPFHYSSQNTLKIVLWQAWGYISA